MSLALEELLQGSRYLGYTYSYPHKTAYRPLPTRQRLGALWDREDRSALFLYAHIPFCEMRCGFCNLFTQIGADRSRVQAYLQQLERQAERVEAEVGPARFARVAIGGGTPTLLEPAELERLFDLLERMGADLRALPTGIELSPRTSTPDRLQVAKDRGMDRVSVGIQSFFDDELKALGRPSSGAEARAAVERLVAMGFPIVNVDLIYGASQQSVQSFLRSLEIALEYAPEEIYLYPLYVRPLTGLGRRGRSASDLRETQFDAGRERLLDAGYEQVSLRMFRRRDGQEVPGPVYRCQEDGMVGLGCGARSYTRTLHYADDWAVSGAGVRSIIDDWLAREPDSFRDAWYGMELDEEEQRRRYVIQSVSVDEGLDLEHYARRFGAAPGAHFPELEQMLQHGLLEAADARLRPTSDGLAWADAVGPWLYSEAVRRRMGAFELR